MKTLGLMLAVLFLAGKAWSEVQAKTVEYQQGAAILEGVVVFDNSVAGKRPGVLVVPAWKGVNDFAIDQAKLLAKLGYVAFVADIYGKGVRPKDMKEAAATAGIYKANRSLLRERAKAALDVLRRLPQTDATRLAAVGYCFGGMTALELARTGADLKGTVSFHGNLDTPNPLDAKNIKGKILALHGAEDPYVTRDVVGAFQDEMTKAGVDWQLNVYSGAVHAYMDPASGNDKSKGQAYNPEAAKRSWEAMKAFFAEVL